MYSIIDPKSEVTQRHIVNYDRLSEFTGQLPLKYTVFPQLGTTIGFYKDVLIEVNGNEITISKSSTKNFKVLFFGKYLVPLTITYKESVDEIAINFSETGINHFFTNPSLIQVYDGDTFGLEADKLFHQNNEIAFDYLENYLLNKYIQLPLQDIEKGVLLVNKNPELTIKEIAAILSLTEKTLRRRFQKYVGCTISNYKSIVRFRKSINLHFKDNVQNLTMLCMENNYFDSSHFNREIKKNALLNPKAFFSKVRANGSAQYPYIFE